MLKKFLIISLIVLSAPLFLEAETEDSVRHFFIEENYDLRERKELGAELIKSTEKILFYADKAWWVDLSEDDRDKYKEKSLELGLEFEERIYGKMTQLFGPIPVHPVWEKEEIIVLFHPMNETAGGYFNSGDQYSRHQNTGSNETNMLYLNTEVFNYRDAGGFLAHEFMHLLTFNQKERLRGVREEIWLNEARAEFVPTLLGYDDLDDSNLNRRAETFLKNPNESLTEWVGKRADYGIVNIFTQYLVDHYGVDILVDSLKSNYTGIESINHALDKNNHKEDFHDVFNNFKIAVFLNDCSIGERYCFKSEDLKNIRITPSINNISFGRGSVSVKYSSKNWSGNWHKLTGGKGDLLFEIEVEKGLNFEVPYFLCDKNNYCFLSFMKSEDGKARLDIEDFGTEYYSLIFMPSIQDKIRGYNGAEEEYLLSWKAKTTEEKDEKMEILERINRLRSLLESLKEEVSENNNQNCTIRGPVYYGATDSESVSCLQAFLATYPDIYPEGYVTGNFLSLTREAVIRFQEKYSEEILEPIGLNQGTGYVGPRTISKINNLRQGI